MKKGLIKATDAFERIVHWSLAVSCLILCITGLGMMFHSFNFIGTLMGGLKSLKYIHNFSGLFFILAIVFTIRMWWKEAGIFSMPEDLEWMMCAGGYLWHVDKVPEVGKYNPGQKAFFLAVAFFVHLYLGTIGSPGSLPAMLHGWVTRSWLKKQHAKWLREMEEAGMLEVYGEEKKTAHGH